MDNPPGHQPAEILKENETDFTGFFLYRKVSGPLFNPWIGALLTKRNYRIMCMRKLVLFR